MSDTLRLYIGNYVMEVNPSNRDELEQYQEELSKSLDEVELALEALDDSRSD